MPEEYKENEESVKYICGFSEDVWDSMSNDEQEYYTFTSPLNSIKFDFD